MTIVVTVANDFVEQQVLVCPPSLRLDSGGGCRDATKIDKNRRATLTKLLTLPEN
jgi:hypothetical protein